MFMYIPYLFQFLSDCGLPCRGFSFLQIYSKNESPSDKDVWHGENETPLLLNITMISHYSYYLFGCVSHALAVLCCLI